MSATHERDARRIRKGAAALLAALRGDTSYVNPSPIAPDAKIARGTVLYVVAPGTPWHGAHVEVLRADIGTDANPYVPADAKARHDMLVAFVVTRRNALIPRAYLSATLLDPNASARDYSADRAPVTAPVTDDERKQVTADAAGAGKRTRRTRAAK